MKVAVPVLDDSLEIVERTGQAPFFAVFEINEDKSYNFLELREVPAGHNHHHDEGHNHEDEKDHSEGHNRQSRVISDCEYIFVKRVGPHMREALENNDIKIKMFRRKDGDNAKDYVAKFVSELGE